MSIGPQEGTPFGSPTLNNRMLARRSESNKDAYARLDPRLYTIFELSPLSSSADVVSIPAVRRALVAALEGRALPDDTSPIRWRAKVWIRRHGKVYMARVLVDSGAHGNFISCKFADRLNIAKR